MITKINQLLGSETRVKILAKLALNSDSAFYMRELERELGINFASIHRELTNLKKLGLVTDERRGKIRLFRINKSSPIYPEVRGLMLKTAGIGDVIRDALKGVGEVKYALVFGSIARGDEKTSSDVDLLLIGDIDEEKLIAKTRNAEDKIGREINYIIWSEKEFKKRIKERMGLLIEIGKNPIVMLVGDENEFRKSAKGRGNSKGNA